MRLAGYAHPPLSLTLLSGDGLPLLWLKRLSDGDLHRLSLPILDDGVRLLL